MSLRLGPVHCRFCHDSSVPFATPLWIRERVQHRHHSPGSYFVLQVRYFNFSLFEHKSPTRTAFAFVHNLDATHLFGSDTRNAVGSGRIIAIFCFMETVDNNGAKVSVELNNQLQNVKSELNVFQQLEKWPKNFKLQFEVRKMDKKFKDVESELTRLLSRFSLLNQMKEPISDFPEDTVKSIYRNAQIAEKNMKTLKSEMSLLSEKVDLSVKQVFQTLQSCRESMVRLTEVERNAMMQDTEFRQKLQSALQQSQQLDAFASLPSIETLLSFTSHDLDRLVQELRDDSKSSKSRAIALQRELETLQGKYQTVLKEVHDLSSALERKKYSAVSEITGKMCQNATEIKKIVTSLSGVEIKSISSSSIRMKLELSQHEFAVDFELSPNSDVLSVSLLHGNLEPCHISVEDISQVVCSSQDMAFAIREIRDRLMCYFDRLEELEEIKKNIPCKWNSEATDVTVTLIGGIIFSFQLDMNYPMRNSPVRLVDVSFMGQHGDIQEIVSQARRDLNGRKGVWNSIGSSLSQTIKQFQIILISAEKDE